MFTACCLILHGPGTRHETASRVDAHYTIYEAEDQQTTGLKISARRSFLSLAGEASGRRAVLLNPEDSIEVVPKSPVNGLTVRYAVSGSGAASKAPALLIAVGGHAVSTMHLNRRYVVAFGTRDLARRQAADRAPRFWDEERTMLPKTLPAGARISLRVPPSGPAVAIDLIETALVEPPAPPPRHALQILSYGADPTGHRSSQANFTRAIADARKRREPLYVSPGRYRLSGHVVLDRVHVMGAGTWYSVIFGHWLGFYSTTRGSTDVRLSGVAVESDVAERNNHLPRAAIGGRFSRSSFTNLFLQHANVGMWMDGPAHDLKIANVQITDQAADGINLHSGISRALVENNRIRNSGDDGIASWSERMPNRDVVISGNEIVAPRLANGIAIYGGHNIEVSGNRIADTLTQGGGIHLGARFNSARFSGRILVADNRIIRSGSKDPHWGFGIGAIWIYALERPIDASISIFRNTIETAGCEAVQLLGPRRIDGVSIESLQILGPVSSVFAVQAGGSMTARNVISSGTRIRSAVEVPTGFRLISGAGNQGWTARRVDRAVSPACM